MKLKRLVQLALISGSILALGACSHTHKLSQDEGFNDMAGGAQASGAGGESNFGEGDTGPRDARYKRIYYFDYDRSDVHGSDMPAINANASYLVAHPGIRVVVEGHTDPRGSREYNVALGERRAAAVAGLLKSKGVRPGQIRVVSYGAERLAAPGHSESDYQQDRRAVIVYTQK